MLLVDDKRIHFLILGDGMERQRLKDKAQDLGIKNVTFGGSQPKSKIGKYLAASDACIATLMNIAMFQMTYPNKVFDYMAAGRPTILGIDGVIREVMETAKGGVFVHPGSAEEIADVIRRLVANPEEVEKMGKCARDYVVQNFNRKDHARLFLDLMEQYI
jgi:glycosyltransferase involved in cell wall biosynthesis